MPHPCHKGKVGISSILKKVSIRIQTQPPDPFQVLASPGRLVGCLVSHAAVIKQDRQLPCHLPGIAVHGSRIHCQVTLAIN